VEAIERDKTKKLQRRADGEIEEITIELTPSNIRLKEVTRFTIGDRTELDEWEDRFKRLVFTQQANGYAVAWITYRLAEMNPPLAVWQIAQKHLGYKHGWAFHRWRECQEVAV
jgi:hypothetical protein